MVELGFKLRAAMIVSFLVVLFASTKSDQYKMLATGLLSFLINTECWSGLGAVALKTGNQLTGSTLVKDYRQLYLNEGQLKM